MGLLCYANRKREKQISLLALPVHITQEARAHYFRVSLVYFGSFQFETPAEEATRWQQTLPVWNVVLNEAEVMLKLVSFRMRL